MEDHTGPLLDLSHASPDIISMVLGSMSLQDRCNCALVCRAWAEAATAATHRIILRHKMHLSDLQHWLETHGNSIEVLHLHNCCDSSGLTALPCCAKLQDLLLDRVSIASRTWTDIASATKLTSVSLRLVDTTAQQADVVAALTALPNLEQLTWCYVECSEEPHLFDSLLLQKMTQLTSLDLCWVAAAALQHLSSLTKLQHLSISAEDVWLTAGCPGLPELKAITSLKLASSSWLDLPATLSKLTALQQLDVQHATPTALDRLQVLTGLTHLCVSEMRGTSIESAPLQLPGLQHLALSARVYTTMPMLFLASCTRLQYLKLRGFDFKGPGSLVASTMLQHLELRACSIPAADGASDPVSWRQVFPGPGQLPHLTSLQLYGEQPQLQQADMEAVVASCSNLQVLGRDRFQVSCAPTLARLPGLTSLQVYDANDNECSAIVQLTGLRQLMVIFPGGVSAAGLRQLAALQQLTSLGFATVNYSKLHTSVKLLIKDELPDYPYAIVNKVCAKVVDSEFQKSRLAMCLRCILHSSSTFHTVQCAYNIIQY